MLVKLNLALVLVVVLVSCFRDTVNSAPILTDAQFEPTMLCRQKALTEVGHNL